MLLVDGLLALGGIVALLQRAEPGVVALLLLLSGVLNIAYLTRRHVVSITVDSGTHLSFETKGIRWEAVIGFLANLEQAKNQRMLYLGRAGH
jgi:hypothetical protein